MSAWIVYSKDGLTERCELHAVEYGGTHMGERAVTATFESDSKVDFDIFDYLSYRGEVFELESAPTVKKTSSFEYSYELRFVSRKYELERCEMRDLVPSDNGVVYPTPLSFSFTGDVRYLTDRIQACLDDLYGEGVWNIVIADGVESEEKNITIAQQNCWNALALVNSTYGLDFYIKGRVITIGGSQPVVSHVFEYGKGNGLYEIERAANTDTAIVTKLRAYGSDRNLDYSYPKKPEWSDSNLPISFAFSPLRLMLPSFKVDKTDYVLADEETIKKYGIREASIVYEDIYPSITGATHNGQAIDEIKAVDVVDDNASTFVVYLPDLGFDLEEHLTTTDAQISMKSGAMQGYTFTISNIEKQEDNSYKITLGRVSAEGGENYNIPNSDWNMREGDKFVLLNILMPQKYIREAENRLKQRAEEYLAQYSKTNFGYNIGLHDKFLIENPSVYDALIEGSKLSVYDEELGISEDVTIQSITITENAADNTIPQVKVTLNNEPSASTLDRIQGKIDSLANESAANNFATQSEIMAQYRKKLDKPFFDKLFAAVDAEGNEIPSTDTVTPVAYIKARYDFAVVGGVTMYLNDGSLDLPSIFEGIPVDNDTIYWAEVKDEEGNVIARILKSRGVGEGGVTPTLLGDLTNVGSWANGVATEDRIMVQKKDSSSWEALGLSKIGGSVSFENVKESGEGNVFTSFILSDDKKTLTFLKDKTFAEKSSTLSGYGIADAYTKTEADNFLAKKWTQDNNKIANWDAAFGWGDHSKANYATKSSTLLGYGITDAYTKTSVDSLLSAKWTKDDAKISNWDTAYSWGNHAQAGYFKSADFTKNKIKATLGISEWALASTKPSYTTKEVAEDTNLYFTNQRAVSALAETLKDYVTLSGTQTITGEKNFTGGLKVNGQPIVYNSDGYWLLDGDLIVTGGVTMFGNDSAFSPSTITQAVNVDGTTIINDGKKLMLNPDIQLGGGGGEISTVAWGNVLGKPSWITDTKPEYKYSEIKETPNLGEYAKKGTTLSAYGITDANINNGVITLGSDTITPLTQSLGDARYVTALGTSGNDLTWTKNGAVNKFTVPYSTHSAHASYLKNYLGDYSSITDLNEPSTFEDGQYRVVYDYYNRSASNNPVTQNNANGVLTFFKGIHITGGGQYMSQLAFPDKDAVYFRRASDGVFGDWKLIAFTDSDITGNAGTATALKDRRSLWGQWFDGKDNVSGDMTGVGSVTMDGQLSLDGITIRKSADGVLFVDGNLVVSGGVTMYGTDGTTAPLIWDDAPIANTNGKKGVASYDPNFFSVSNGVVTFIGQTGGGVTDYNDLNNKPDLSVYALKTALDNYQTKITSSNKLPYSLVDGTPDLSGYITKGISLSHYGITDAYTKTEADNNFVAKTTKDFMKVNGSLTSNVDFNDYYTSGSYNNTTGNGSGNSNTPGAYGLMLVFGDKSGYAAQLHVDSGNTSVKIRTRYIHGGSFSWKNWAELAYTTSNVASATRLETPRKIWGQDFDGTEDVSGAITGATTGSFSGNVSMGSATINGGKLTYDSTNKYWKLEGDLLVTGGVTMFGNDSAFSPSTITQAVNVDGTTIINDGKKLMLNPDIQLGGGGVTDYNDLTNKPDLTIYALKTSLSSYQTKITSTNKLDYGLISGTPTIPTNTNQLTNGAGFITSSGSITGNAATATTASKLSTTSKTAWGQTYWTSSGVPTDINGDMSSVGNITPLKGGTYSIGSYGSHYKWVNANCFSSGAIGNGLWLCGGTNSGTGVVIARSGSNTATGELCRFTDKGMVWASGVVSDILNVGNITSSSNGSYSIGSSSNLWNEIWCKRIKNNDSLAIGFGTNYVAVNAKAGGAQLIVEGDCVRTNSDTNYRASLGTSTVPWKGVYSTDGYFSGNVGIGVTTAEYKLHVNGDIGNANVRLRYSTSNPYLALMRTTSSELWYVQAVSGYLAIGGGSAVACKIDASGNFLSPAGITMYSDVRKKTILNHVELSLKEVADAPLIEHYYNSDESKRTHVGSVAQYWAGLNDWFCKEDEEGFLTMEIQNAALASAISVARELTRYESKTDKQIKKLKKRIGELEEEIENLKKM